MDTASISPQGSSASSTLLAQLKAEQGQASSNPQELRKLGVQLVKNAEANVRNAQKAQAVSPVSRAADPLGQLLGSGSDGGDPLLYGADGRAALPGPARGTASASDLAAKLSKTEPGPGGNQARAEILATLNASQGTQAPASYGQQSPTLFSFLG